jgi:hypothetical protein
MSDYTGNAIPAPGLTRGTVTTDDELLYASEPGSYHQKGVTLEPGQGVLLLGTILARKTSTKRYVKYASGGSDGAGTALGILRKTVDTGTDPEGQVWQANILYSGFLKLDKVSAANSGVTLTSILSAQVNSVEGFFKF